MRPATAIPFVLGSIAIVLTAAGGRPAASSTTEGPRARRIELAYEAAIPVPPGARRVDVWLPLPSTDAHQSVEIVGIETPVPFERRREAEYGNELVYFRVDEPDDAVLHATMRFRVERREYVRRDFDGRERAALPDDPEIRRWLEPDRLVPLDDYVTGLAEAVTAGATSRLAKARAIYDYTVDELVYDKSGTGWGRGDIYYACDAKRGNCTDFHAVFIGFARAVGIPARFAIGLPLPADRTEGDIDGYHCWAEFYLPGYGWVPVDTSEANKHPERREYFFGAHDENRVQFTVGRDIVLAPPQAGEPLNYFVYPYAEADGEPVDGIGRAFHYRDLPVDPTATPASPPGR